AERHPPERHRPHRSRPLQPAATGAAAPRGPDNPIHAGNRAATPRTPTAPAQRPAASAPQTVHSRLLRSRVSSVGRPHFHRESNKPITVAANPSHLHLFSASQVTPQNVARSGRTTEPAGDDPHPS